jgi:hypothetical protein
MMVGGLCIEKQAYQRGQVGGGRFRYVGMRMNFAVGMMMMIVERVIVAVFVVVDVNVTVRVEVVQQVVAHFQRAVAEHGHGIYDQYNSASPGHKAKVGNRFGYKRKEAAIWQPLFIGSIRAS